jgi:hypothetical protein
VSGRLELRLAPSAIRCDAVRIIGLGVLELVHYDVDEPEAMLLEPGEYVLVELGADGTLTVHAGVGAE